MQNPQEITAGLCVIISPLVYFASLFLFKCGRWKYNSHVLKTKLIELFSLSKFHPLFCPRLFFFFFLWKRLGSLELRTMTIKLCVLPNCIVNSTLLEKPTTPAAMKRQTSYEILWSRWQCFPHFLTINVFKPHNFCLFWRALWTYRRCIQSAWVVRCRRPCV